MKDYQYILTWNTTTETLGYSPAGYDKLGITWMRHEVYHSVLRSFTLSLRFVNINRGGLTGGYQLIKQAYDTEGIYAEVGIEIKKRNPDTNDYDTLYTGVLDFTPGRWTIDRDLFWEIAINDSSVLQKFISRDENEIDVLGTKTLDNQTISQVATSQIDFTPIDIIVKYKAILDSKGNLVLDQNEIFPILYSGDSFTESVPDEIILNQLDKVTIGGTYGSFQPELWEKIYTNTDTDTKKIRINISIDYSQSININTSTIGSYAEKIYFKLYDELDNIKSYLVYTLNSGSYVVGNNNYSKSGNLSAIDFIANVANGDYIKAHYVFECTTSVTQIHASPLDFHPALLCELEVSETTFGKPTSTIYGVMPFNAINQSLRILTGEANTLDSSVFESGGSLENDFITNGSQIRKYPQPGLNFTFRKLFKSFDGIANLGLWYDRINNKFVIEQKREFYKDELLFNLSGVTKFKIQPYTNAYYNKITAGFDNTGNYERVQGAYEFAVKREYSTSTTVKEDKNIEVPYRFDSVMIEELRNYEYVNYATEDNDADNHIFIVRTDGTNPILPDVGSPEYLGMDVFYSYYNTMLTPRQNTVRWGNVIKACCYHNTNPIQAQKTEKQFELEVDGLDENSGIAVSELGEALFIPELYIFESYLTPANIQTLLTNPHGYIDFHYNGVEYSGFVNKIELTDNNRKAIFELIARNNIVINRTFTNGNMHVFTNGNQMINA